MNLMNTDAIREFRDMFPYVNHALLNGGTESLEKKVVWLYFKYNIMVQNAMTCMRETLYNDAIPLISGSINVAKTFQYSYCRQWKH